MKGLSIEMFLNIQFAVLKKKCKVQLSKEKEEMKLRLTPMKEIMRGHDHFPLKDGCTCNFSNRVVDIRYRFFNNVKIAWIAFCY